MAGLPAKKRKAISADHEKRGFSMSAVLRGRKQTDRGGRANQPIGAVSI
jgi:hypothetical protein